MHGVVIFECGTWALADQISNSLVVQRTYCSDGQVGELDLALV